MTWHYDDVTWFCDDAIRFCDDVTWFCDDVKWLCDDVKWLREDIKLLVLTFNLWFVQLSNKFENSVNVMTVYKDRSIFNLTIVSSSETHIQIVMQ